MGVIFTPNHFIWQIQKNVHTHSQIMRLPNWKCVMRYCYKCPSIDLPDQETYDQYPNTSFSISFKIYDLITRCKTHVRLPLTNNKICRKCKENTVTEQSTKIYTRKELLMTDTTF